MKEIATAFVHGDPKAQPRTRASSFGGGRARVYDPGTANGWKNLIAQALRKYAGQAITDALHVDLTFFFPRPRSHFGTGKNSKLMKEFAPEFHTKKPDIDNLEKAVYDALSEKSGIGLWKDDAQIVSCRPHKMYADGSPVGMRIAIYSLTKGKENYED